MNKQSDASIQLKKIFARCHGGLALSFALSVALTILGVMKPIYMIIVFSRITPSNSVISLYWLTIIIFAALILLGIFHYVRARLHQRIGNWLGQALGVDTLEPIILRTLRGRGDPSETLRDIQSIRGFFSGSFIPSAMEFALSPVFFLVLYLLHPLFVVIVLSYLLLLTGLAVVNELSNRQITKDAISASQESTREVGNYLKNAEVIEAMGMQRPVLDLWWQSNERALALNDQTSKRAAANRAISSVVPLFAIITILFVGSLLTMSGEVGASSSFVAMFAASMALAPTLHLLGNWRSLVEVRLSYKRLLDLLAEGQGARSTMPLPSPEAGLEIDNLTFVPPGARAPVLRGASFQVQPGEAVAVVGSSGAGKSTLARLLVGVWSPTAGVVTLDGHSVYTWERESFGQMVGYLPQEVGLFNTTVGKNISRLRAATDEQIIAAAEKAGIHHMIGALDKGYDTEISSSSYSLTGGQRQLVGLARALFGAPRLLVLDEPDANLDADSQQRLVEAIEAAKAEGAIVVVVSHRQNIMAAVDKVLLLNQGRVQAFVTKAQWETRDSQASSQPAGKPAKPSRLIAGQKE